MIPVLIFLAVTSTPGISAPEASETVPLSTALTCANPWRDASNDSTNVATTKHFLIVTSTFFFLPGTLSQDVKYMNHIANPIPGRTPNSEVQEFGVRPGIRLQC